MRRRNLLLALGVLVTTPGCFCCRNWLLANRRAGGRLEGRIGSTKVDAVLDARKSGTEIGDRTRWLELVSADGKVLIRIFLRYFGEGNFPIPAAGAPDEALRMVQRVEVLLPKNAPAISGGWLIVTTKSTNHVDGRVDLRFVDGTALSVAYDVKEIAGGRLDHKKPGGGFGGSGD